MGDVKKETLFQLVELALKELDALGAKTVPEQIRKALRQPDTRMEGGGEIAYVHTPSEIAEVYGADIIERMGIPAAWHSYVRLTIEQAIDHDRSKSQAAPSSPTVGELEYLAEGLRSHVRSIDMECAPEESDLWKAADTLSAAQSSIQRAERERDEARENATALKGLLDFCEDSIAKLERKWQFQMDRADAAEAQLEEARKEFKYIAKTWPDSSAAKSARAFLASLREKQDAE